MKINHLQAIRVFLRVADSGGFGAAATSLGVSNAVVSRYVALLETHLGTRLVNRTTHHVSLTAAGEAYAAGCRAVVAQIDALEAEVCASAQLTAGNLRLVATADFPCAALSALLIAFRERFSRVTVDLTLAQRPVDLVQEGFDAGIVTPQMLRSGTLVCRPLAHLSSVLVGAPAYLDAHGAPRSPPELAEHALLAAAPGKTEWTFDGPDGAVSVPVAPVLTANHALMLTQSAVDGLGLALVPSGLADGHLERGELRQVLPGWRPRGRDMAVSVVYPGRRHVPAKTRGFVDFVLAYFRSGAYPRNLVSPPAAPADSASTVLRHAAEPV